MPIHDALGEGPFKTELIVAGGMAILLALLADGLLVAVQRLLTPWSRIRGEDRRMSEFGEAFEFILRNGEVPGYPNLPASFTWRSRR